MIDHTLKKSSCTSTFMIVLIFLNYILNYFLNHKKKISRSDGWLGCIAFVIKVVSNYWNIPWGSTERKEARLIVDGQVFASRDVTPKDRWCNMGNCEYKIFFKFSSLLLTLLIIEKVRLDSQWIYLFSSQI